MTEPPSILAYEPPQRGRRRVHPIFAAVIAHCVACYALAGGGIVLTLLLGSWPGPRMRAFLAEALLHYLPWVPFSLPVSLWMYFSELARGRVRLEARPFVWALLYLAVVAVAFWLLIRRRRTLLTLKGAEPPA